MKKIIILTYLVLISLYISSQGNSQIDSYAKEKLFLPNGQLSFLRLKENKQITETKITEFINTLILNDNLNKVEVQKRETDALGFTHTKFNIFQNGILCFNKIVIAHSFQNKLVSLNGDLSAPGNPGNKFLLSEKVALTSALKRIGAKKYKWENKEEEAQMKKILNDPAFSYLPNGVKIVFEKEGIFYNAYQYNIYAEEPLFRANIIVDAETGKILEQQNLLCSVDVPATANTKYSGTQTITCNQNGSIYSLKETQRGLGIETYNAQNLTTLTSIDFTSATTSWTTTGVDQAATDAHWGAEKTYDYYWTQHSRNSIDNSGQKLISYVHYGNSMSNAFWDGQEMLYGNGSSSSGTQIYTALDICGHEITHGLTANTASLSYMNESGALNESFSDIFGTVIENYARPLSWNWLVGENVTINGSGLRNMANPNAKNDPDTYGGTYYNTGVSDNGGVHHNSGISNYWFYLLTMGGSGINDISNTFSVTGIGMTNSAKIAYRALTVYFTPSTNFSTARNLTLQAARDLFGNCSSEFIQTMKAWYAVGIGPDYTPGLIGPDFISDITGFCSPPSLVNFTNTTINGFSYSWDFGDGSITSSISPVHTYTAAGVYTVKLKALGCLNTMDSVIKTSYITVNQPILAPVATGTSICVGGSAILNASANGIINWYSYPTGSNTIGAGSVFVTPILNTTTTYYVESRGAPFPSVSGGMLSNASGGYSLNNGAGMYFDVTAEGTLNSVDIYAQTAMNATVQIYSSSNLVFNLLNSTPLILTSGFNLASLNYSLIPGSNYMLLLLNNYLATDKFYMSNTGMSYPYNIGNCINITSSSGGGGYPWFYNWQVTKNACESQRTSVTVTVNPTPTLNINGNNQVCTGSSLSQSVVGASSYTWSNGAFTPTVILSPTTTTSYSVVGVNNFNCYSATSKTINVKPLPLITISGNASICSGDFVTLLANGASTYTWSNGIQNNSNSFSPAITTVYTVSGTGQNSCSSSSSKTVTVNPLPILTISGDTSVCLGSSVTQTINGADFYIWSTGQNSNIVNLTPTASSQYSVTGTTLLGCASSITNNITVKPLPSVILSSSNTLICLGETSMITPGGAITYTLNNGVSALVFQVNPLTTSTYSVSGTGGDGCTNVSFITIQLDDCTNLMEIDNNNTILIFPNPTKEYLIIKAQLIYSRLIVTDPSGRLMLTQDLNASEEIIKLNSLSNGIYIVSILDASGKSIKTMKLVKE